jgi:multicomponent Na+:H+ antiporter subunit B
MVEIYLMILLVFMILGAMIAVETKTLISSVISLGAIGFGLSIAFLFLRAPDLAIVQIAVEVILLIFLIRATIGREVVHVKGRIGAAGLAAASLLLAAFLVFTVIAFEDLFRFGSPVFVSATEAPAAVYIARGLKETGAANIVSAVILDYRAYDTLGEATVLFAAVIGALTVLRLRVRGRGGK